MRLKILLPYRVFLDQLNVRRVVLETREGSFGILPHRLDFAAMLTPGILCYEDANGAEKFIANNRGMAVKTGATLLVSVRNAVGDTDLGNLKRAIDTEFSEIEASDSSARVTAAKLESTLLRRFMDIKDA